MAVLTELLAGHTGLSEGAVDHLELLLVDWQILADLSFADLLLFIRDTLPDGSPGYLCIGQMRPYTAQTIYKEDLVGVRFAAHDRPIVGRALAEGRIIGDTDPDWSMGVPVREEAVPVRFRGEIIAVVTREANVSSARAPSELELTYLQVAADLARMLAEGTFPYEAGPDDERERSPRVGDGVIRLDASGTASYASPNAVSAYRRLGLLESVIGRHVTEFDPGAEELLEALADAVALESEVEWGGRVVLRRLLPLIAERRVTAGLMLVSEVTELRRHERALQVKDATIREIHHRVKNNLQTVASLLRLQARRLGSEEARAALAESVRRISSIALVHETLSQESRQRVSFGKVARRIVDMLSAGLVDPEMPVRFELEGTPGELSAEVATPLALVLTELLQNSVEHGFPRLEPPGDDEAAAARAAQLRERLGGDPGLVRVEFERGPGTLRVVVSDNGVGLPPQMTLDGVANLGLQIARTLVESELGGTFRSPPGDEAPGTSVELVLPLR